MTTATIVLLVVLGVLLVGAIGYGVHRWRANRMWDAVDRAINQSSIFPPDQQR